MTESVGSVPSRTYDIVDGSTSLIKGYLPALDGWRAISILLVLVSHGGLGHIVPGGLGVTIFFFISGFLITSLLISELQKNNHIALGQFYLRRFWRLSPPLLVYVLASIVFIYLINGPIKFWEIFSAIFYFANYYSLYWNFEPMPSGPSPLKILWSLAIEEHYYLFFAPLLAFIAFTPKKLLALLLILTLGPLLVRCAVVYGSDQFFVNTGYTYMATEARIDSIAWGGILAWTASKYKTAQINQIFDSKITVALSIFILILCLLIRDERFRESTRYTLQGMALTAVLYSSIYGDRLQWCRTILTNKLVVSIGKLSYSIYLYHWLALVIANWLIGPEKLSLNWLLCYYGLSFILAIASYRLVERPTLAIRKRFGSHV